MIVIEMQLYDTDCWLNTFVFFNDELQVSNLLFATVWSVAWSYEKL